MECVWPLSPILMLFGSAIVVVLIKTSKTKLKGMEMEFENKSSGFFILLPALPLHLFFFYVCFLCCLFYSFSFPLFFLISHPLSFPSSPSLPSPTFASTTLPLILSFTFFSSCSSFTITIPFCSSSHLSLVWLVISSDCPWLDFVTIHFVFVPRELLILVPYQLNHKFREPFAIHICKNNKVFFQILNSFISSSKQSRTALILCENHKNIKTMD